MLLLIHVVRAVEICKSKELSDLGSNSCGQMTKSEHIRNSKACGLFIVSCGSYGQWYNTGKTRNK